MNTLPTILTVYLALALEVSLRQPLAIGASGIAPHFVIVVVVFVAMCGHGLGVFWTALAGFFLWRDRVGLGRLFRFARGPS